MGIRTNDIIITGVTYFIQAGFIPVVPSGYTSFRFSPTGQIYGKTGSTEYELFSSVGSSDTQILFMSGTTATGNSNLRYDYTGATAYITNVNATAVTGTTVYSSNDYTTGSYHASSGTTVLPSYSFTGDPDTGLYNPSANTLTLVTNGAESLIVSGSNITGNTFYGTTTNFTTGNITNIVASKLTGATFYTSSGLTGGYVWGDGDTVIYESADDALVIKVGGVIMMTLNGTAPYDTTVAGDLYYNLASGWYLNNIASSVTAPPYTFHSDNDTGFSSPSANTISIINGGSEILRTTISGVTINQSVYHAASEDRKVTTVTVSTTLDSTHNIVLVNATGATTITLPAAASSNNRTYTIKNINNGTCTVDGNASETIDWDTTQILSKPSSITVSCDGSAWYII